MEHRNSLTSIKSLSTLNSNNDLHLVNNYFSYVNLNEQQKCILQYTTSNPLPEISFNEINKETSEKSKARNKKIIQQALDDDFHVLSLGQKNEFLKFLHDYKTTVNEDNISFSQIEYYIKVFNHCYNQNFPIVKLSDVFKDHNDKYTLILIKEYNKLLDKSKSHSNNRRNAFIKGVSPDYLALSKLQSKYKFYNEIN